MLDVERNDNPKHGLPELMPHIVHRRNRYQILVGAWILISIYPVVIFFTGQPSPVSAQIWQEASSVFHNSLNLVPGTSDALQPILKNALEPGTVINTPDRASDVTNIFANFTQSTNCTFSSLDLHDPFSPLCSDKDSLLTAMTNGGRIGIDAPFSPRGCDMRWYTTDEICKILDKFERVSIIGDSMMRNLAVGLHTLLRTDFIEGPHATWRPDPEGYDCRCGGPFNDGHCIYNAAFSTKLIADTVPESLKCGTGVAPVEFTPLLTYPLEQKSLNDVMEKYAPIKPTKPHVFVYGHGMWNSLNITATTGWVDQLNGALVYQMPWLNGHRAFFPRLFVTPNAAGDDKPRQFLETQGNGALKKFEKDAKKIVNLRNMDHLGTWNMTVQTISPDGTHAGMRAVLTKAMMVLNWLDTLDVGDYRA